MLTYLIGHRGSGKTALLARIQEYLTRAGQDTTCLDLDLLIEEREGRAISRIFSEDGERAFRDLEMKVVSELSARHADGGHSVFLAVGAGFEGRLPSHSRILWIRRPTDLKGRVFLNRPRLDPGISAHRESLERAALREPRFERMATEQLIVPEGFDHPNSAERAYFLDQVDCGRAVLTLLPENFRDFPEFLSRRRSWNLRFEIRDDLLDDAQVSQTLELVPAERILFSRRRSGNPRPLPEGITLDHALELPGTPPAGANLLSLHVRKPGETLLESGRRLVGASRDQELLKLAVEVHSFEELLEGHLWALEDPARRAFLPRSADGRWQWYRRFTGRRCPLAFIREGNGSALDQPVLLDWIRDPQNPRFFSAILGSPVQHSLTPSEQHAYFESKGLAVFPIAVTEQDWDSGALEILRKIGLRAAAVTSPLKLKAAAGSGLASVNTILWDQCWKKSSTDAAGLHALLGNASDQSEWVVWGGGGMLPLLRTELPNASFYSARSGEPRPGERKIHSPRILLWSIGRAREGGEHWPDPAWRPAQVLDLNYGEDSPGREYALKVGARYVSGLEMFRKQAEEQRNFWNLKNDWT